MHDCSLDPGLGGNNAVEVMTQAKAKAAEYYKQLHNNVLKSR